VHKKESCSIQLQNFLSEELGEQKQTVEYKEEARTSLGNLFEETKIRVGANTIGFKLHRNNPSIKSTKADLNSTIERVIPRLSKLLPRPSLKPPPLQPSVFREKFRSLIKGQGRVGG
jgi:hypothetical protein